MSYLATDLNAGSTYEFTVEARNSYGFSIESDLLSLLCAFKPEAPTEVTTLNENELVKVTWTYPVANGSPITAYKIFFLESDGFTFSQESVQCDGTDSQAITLRTCYVTLELLKAQPYNLVKDDQV